MRDPYSRVYWSVQHDPKFDGIREDMRLMGSWLTLLLVADQTWPAPAYPPPIVTKGAVTALAKAGLIDLMSGGRYRVHGLDTERIKRSEVGRAGGIASGIVRQPSERSLNGSSRSTFNVSPNLAEQSKDEKSKAHARDEWDDDRPDLEAFLLLTRRAPTPRQRILLDSLMDRHDQTGPQWAADVMMRHPDDPIGAVIEADKAYRTERIAQAQAAEKPKPVVRRRKSMPIHTRELLEHWAKENGVSQDGAA